jgi:hypothetical protein
VQDAHDQSKGVHTLPQVNTSHSMLEKGHGEAGESPTLMVPDLILHIPCPRRRRPLTIKEPIVGIEVAANGLQMARFPESSPFCFSSSCARSPDTMLVMRPEPAALRYSSGSSTLFAP